MMQKPIIEVKFSCTSFMGRRNQLQLLLDVWELYVCHYFLNEYQCSLNGIMLMPVNQFHTNQFDAKPPAVEFEPWYAGMVKLCSLSL